MSINVMTVGELRDILADAQEDDLVAVTCTHGTSRMVHPIMSEEDGPAVIIERTMRGDGGFDPMVLTVVLHASADFRVRV